MFPKSFLLSTSVWRYYILTSYFGRAYRSVSYSYIIYLKCQGLNCSRYYNIPLEGSIPRKRPLDGFSTLDHPGPYTWVHSLVKVSVILQFKSTFKLLACETVRSWQDCSPYWRGSDELHLLISDSLAKVPSFSSSLYELLHPQVLDEVKDLARLSFLYNEGLWVHSILIPAIIRSIFLCPKNLTPSHT